MPEPDICVVDDDPLVRDALRLLMRSVGLDARTFGEPQALLDAPLGESLCLVTDLRMPGMSGIELMECLQRRGHRVAAVMISGHGDVPLAVKAMKAGVLDFLTKPFNDQELLDATHRALRALAAFAPAPEAALRLERLTSRERQVLDMVVAGQPNKLIARALDVSTRTVEAHRAHLMEKLGVKSLAELIRLAVGAGRSDR